MKHGFLIFAVLVFGQSTAQASSVPNSKEIHFQILRNGSPFGTHSLVFSENEKDQTVVDINIQMKYSLGPVNIFKYVHSNQEIWEGNEIVSVNSYTYDNGEEYSVEAVWYDDYADIRAQNKSYDAPASIYSTSYWNKAMLEADELLNTQKGNIEKIKVTSLGKEDIISEGQTIEAEAYQLDAHIPLKIWYDADSKEWVKLKFTIRGSELEYVRVAQHEREL